MCSQFRNSSSFPCFEHPILVLSILFLFCVWEKPLDQNTSDPARLQVLEAAVVAFPGSSERPLWVGAHTRMHTCAHILMHMDTGMCAHTCTCKRAHNKQCTLTHARALVHTHTCKHAHTNMCTHAHSHKQCTHTCTYVHTHTYTLQTELSSQGCPC